jgi:uncharacterized protein YndB with AHSA1/START domain
VIDKKQKTDRKGRIIQKEMTTSATPQQIWEAWADPGKLSQWFTDDAEGEAKSGGSMTWIFDEFEYRFTYEVLEARPEERLVLTATPPGRSSPWLIEIDIEQAGGRTVLKLVQSGFGEGAEWDDEYEGVDSGWEMALAVLKHYAENYFGRPRRQALVITPAEYTASQLRPFYREEASLAKWLTRAGAVGDTGSPYELELADGNIMTGKVLANTRTEVELSWREIEGAMGLKAFSMHSKKVLCIQLLTWGDPKRLETIEKSLTSSLERLKSALSA